MRGFHKSVTGDLIHSDLSSIYFHRKNRKEKEYSSFIICKWSLTTCNAQFAKEKRPRKSREGQSCTVVNMDESQNTDQVVKASEVDNVRHEERDYFVKAWIACQYTGLYPHGEGLRQKHWDIIFRLSLCFISGREEGMSAQISGSQSAFQTAFILRCWIRENQTQCVSCLILYNFSSCEIISLAFSLKYNANTAHCAGSAAVRSK